MRLFFRFRSSFVLFLGSILVLTIDPASAGQLQPWDEAVFQEIARQHGEASAKRIRKVHDFVLENQSKPRREQLELTNDLLNGLPWLTDSEKWKLEDYWATPFETLATFGGDCEDIAIAKYVVLRAMGVPDSTLFFAHVKTAKGESHMVLVNFDEQRDAYFVLDNMHPDVLPGYERRDLTAIYLFQNDGTIVLIGDDGKKRFVKKQLEHRNIGKWTTLKERMAQQRAAMLPFNGGRPLLPEDGS